MRKLFYDLHLHSCLSPCGDNDMTPNNMAGMAALKGLQIAALTDHNSSKNCPAFLAACEKNGIVGIAGMELTTSEEIHLVCLFEHLGAALDFSAEVEKHRSPVKNKPHIFGEQLILDENDEKIGEEDVLLINATTLDLETAVSLARSYGAFVMPAHIDKQANGLIGILGTFPETPAFSYAELSDVSVADALIAAHPTLKNCRFLSNSDAHYLWDIHEAEEFLELDVPDDSPASIRKALFEKINHL